jgi:hypothetical protein
VNIKNTEASSSRSLKTGNYAIANVIYFPVPKLMAVAELQFGSRKNFTDGYSSSATKIQFSFKYNFSYSLYGERGK